MTSTEIRLPAPPYGAAAMTIVRWLKQPGDAISAGEPLLIATNDVVEIAFPATIGGELERIVLVEGSSAEAGASLALLATLPIAASPSPASAESSAPRMSPVARRIATAAGVDSGDLRGSGPAGRIMKADVLAALGANGPTPAVPEPAQATLTQPDEAGARIVFAAADAHVAMTAIEVDLIGVAATRSFAEWRGAVPIEMLFVAAAAVETLARHPLLNSAWAADWVVVHRHVHLALTGLDGRRIVIPDAQDFNVRGLARSIARTGSSTPAATSTFAVAAGGEQVWWSAPVLESNQSAALLVGATRLRPVVVAEQGVERVAVRPVALLALAYDARVLDQCRADAFLRDVKAQLEHIT